MFKHKLKTIAIISLVFVAIGGFSVFATWPSAPEGSFLGGWLGQFFNLEESGTGKLVLNAKEMVFPDNPNSILENNQIPTKEYVDSVAGAGVAGVSGGGFCTVVCNGTCPAPQAGWTLSQSKGESGGYAGRCSHNKLDAYLGTENVCCYFPASTVDTGGKSYFVLSNSTWNGDLGGLEGANVKCYQDLKANDWKGKEDVTLSLKNVKAFLCDSNQCNNLLGNREYFFAKSGDTTAGGDSMLVGEQGSGPYDNEYWNTLGKFGGDFSYWTNRYGQPTYWFGVPYTKNLTYSCENFTTVSNSNFGAKGESARNLVQRFMYGSSRCNEQFHLICIVN